MSKSYLCLGRACQARSAQQNMFILFGSLKMHIWHYMCVNLTLYYKKPLIGSLYMSRCIIFLHKCAMSTGCGKLFVLICNHGIFDAFPPLRKKVRVHPFLQGTVNQAISSVTCNERIPTFTLMELATPRVI